MQTDLLFPASASCEPAPRPPLVGVVLAGGRNSRFGADKALLRLEYPGPSGNNAEAPSLLARNIDLLRKVCPRVFVVGRTVPGVPSLPDAVPGLGPVGGVATALQAVPGHACLVLSCDLPFMKEELLQSLVHRRGLRPPGRHMTAFRDGLTGQVQTLTAIYEPEALPYFQDCAARRLGKIVLVVPEEEQFHLPYDTKSSRCFFNINYPEDLEEARRLLGEADP